MQRKSSDSVKTAALGQKPVRKCRQCGGAIAEGRHWLTRYCSLCNIARDKEPFRLRAHAEVQRAIRRGDLPQLGRRDHGIECVDCGKLAYGYDHRDYTKPLAVEPVCQSCNKLRGQGHPLLEVAFAS